MRLNCQIRHCKEVNCTLSKIDLSQANNLSPTVQLDFTWTFKMTDQQNDRFESTLNVSAVLRVQHDIIQGLLQR